MGFTTCVSRFRTAQWLQKAGFAPQVFVFRNLESGQVVYSQLPIFSQRQINLNFPRPNWENKKPSTRRDIWRCMVVVDLLNYESSVKLYQNLCRLRYLRDVTFKPSVQKMRKKNDFGNIWYSAQYRPTYTQEAVADLRESLTKLNDKKNITIHWEDPWRMGDLSKYWTPVLPNLKHEVINRMGNIVREESAILKELGENLKKKFFESEKEVTKLKATSL